MGDCIGIIVTYKEDKSLGLTFQRKYQKTVVFNWCKNVIIENNRLTFKYLDNVVSTKDADKEPWLTFDMSMNDITRCHFMGG